MEMQVTFGQGMQVNAHFDGFEVKTDQPSANGGEGTAPDPYSYFLTGLLTCAGFYVLRFCQTRELATDGIELNLSNDWNRAKGCPDKINIDISIPPTFPRKYHKALVRATQECSVKKTLMHPPEIIINAKTQQ